MQLIRKYLIPAGRPVILSIIAFLYFFNLSLWAQSEPEIRSIIGERDIKKLIKADEYKTSADKLVEEASQLNMDVLLIQADPNLDEKTKAKKSGQIESQAQQKQIQASSLYEKCNEIKFTIYKQYIDAFWKTHEGEETDYLNAKMLEEQSSDHYFQAVSYRIEAKKMDDLFMRLEKLTDANNLENEALQKQITALATYYLKDDVPASKEDVTFLEIATPVEETETSAGISSDTTLLTLDNESSDTSGAEMMQQINHDQTIGQQAIETEVKQQELLPQAETRLPSGVEFRVQIAASRVPLETGKLKMIYQGEHPVEMIMEDGWHKYQLAGVPYYADAIHLLRKVNIPGAFVVAYKNGIKLKLAEAVKSAKELEETPK